MAGNVRKIIDPQIGTVIIRRHHWARNISIKVSENGEVSISAPPRTPLFFINNLFAQRRSWILSQLERRARQPDYLIHDMPIGRDHRLVFQPKFTASQVSSRVTADKIVVSHPAIMSAEDQIVQTAAREATVKALRVQAKSYLPGRLENLSRQTGLDYSACKLRVLKRKWGSCNQDKQITLNIWLMTLPDDLIDYVLLHELNHTKHLNHQKDFWQAMQKNCPDYRERRKRLKQARTLLGQQAPAVS